ncbi:uncharacterized protein LOC125071027 [Vanessa atalanta]|uniref:uncharacterized protein LOC125071027 n=1 Tax=Vanessa atalanta TaxID=42275 RepID=UPI001FCDA2C3|nr:uncharacterized protein LOC125071027 [Vanessa atalanta]
MKESLNKTDWPIKFKMIVHMTSGFIYMSVLQLQLATILKKNAVKDYVKLSFGIAHLIYYYAVLFFPSIIMEMISEQINILKTDIANRVITCTDERRRANLRQLLRYFREKPLKYCIFRAIPVDSRLPLHYVSLAVTYLVCLMQLTHLLED